jgi:hypothetical protein
VKGNTTQCTCTCQPGYSSGETGCVTANNCTVAKDANTGRALARGPITDAKGVTFQNVSYDGKHGIMYCLHGQPTGQTVRNKLLMMEPTANTCTP